MPYYKKKINPKNTISLNNTCTWKFLQDKGYISIDSINRVVFPYFWLHVFGHAIFELTKEIGITWTALENDLKFNWQDFEDFNLEYLVYYFY